MGEARRKQQAGLTEFDCVVEEAPVLAGHLRQTIVDDDDVGCTTYFEVEKVTELLDRAGKLVRNGRTLAEIATDPGRWARLRHGAFNAACERGQRGGVGLLMLWCVMHGPTGFQIRRQVSAVIAVYGYAVIVARRDRTSHGVGVTVGTDATLISTELVREAARRAPDGTSIVVGTERRREDA